MRTSLRSLLLSPDTTSPQRVALILEDALTLKDGTRLNPVVLEDAETRRLLTRRNPLLFAVLYFPNALSAETGEISFNEAHIDLYQDAESWPDKTGSTVDFNALRHCYIWPRGTGKSTMMFKILPAWLGAHGHVKFLAAFSDSKEQAELHLENFKSELQKNGLLRQDYPEFVTPKRMTNSEKAAAKADTQASFMSQSGFTFKAFGVGHPVRGLKVGDDRPDMLLIDDVEKGEENYSLHEAEKRLNTLRNDIFHLEVTARVVIVGTVTRPGSIIHQLVQTVITSEEPEEWVKGARITVHYKPAIITDDQSGEERSLWPQRWPLEYLQDERTNNSASFAQEMMNDPKMGDLRFWTTEIQRIASPLPYWRQIIWIDPAVTYNEDSDFTGISVLSLTPTKVLQVHEAFRRKIGGTELRTIVLDLLAKYPDIVYVMCERNQGGELWPEMVLNDLPVPVNPRVWDAFPQTSSFSNKRASKHIRVQNLCNAYQRSSVIHEKALPQLEAEELAWPNGLVKDTVDAVATGGQHLWAAFALTKQAQIRGQGKRGTRTTSYGRR